MYPYLIEGLDCSGKKAVAKQVADTLAEHGVDATVVIGPICSRILRAFDKTLVNSFNIKAGSIRDKIRKATYAYEPALDGVLYKDNGKSTVIKVSSHYRAWARAIVESDATTIQKFMRHSQKHLKYAGAVLLWTDFDTRLDRHRNDVKTGKTQKNENKRFFNRNKVFFDTWHNELRNLLESNIESVIVIDTTHSDVSEISRQIYHHLRWCLG